MGDHFDRAVGVVHFRDRPHTRPMSFDEFVRMVPQTVPVDHAQRAFAEVPPFVSRQHYVDTANYLAAEAENRARRARYVRERMSRFKMSTPPERRLDT